jgi:hypothetical protein
MKSLTKEQTAGTLTFYFPFERDAITPPRATLIVRRVGEEEWHAGLAVCSDDDMFQRQVGRKIAFHRLQGFPIRGQTPDELLLQARGRIDRVTQRRRYYEFPDESKDVMGLSPRLEAMRVE